MGCCMLPWIEKNQVIFANNVDADCMYIYFNELLDTVQTVYNY